MYRDGKRISAAIVMVMSFAGAPPHALGQAGRTIKSGRTIIVQRFFAEPADPARELFTAGQKFFDQSRYIDAERAFRQVLLRFSKSTLADKTDYYLIRTLVQIGKKTEALDRINAFSKAY